MTEIGLSNIKKNYGFKNVLNGVEFEVNTGDKIAIVGKNGSGKTTVFKIITGVEKAESGTVAVRKGATIGFLEQLPKKVDDSFTVRDVLNLGISDLIELADKMERLENEMANPENIDNIDPIMKNYEKVQDSFITKGGYELAEKISKICSVFKISEDRLNQKYNSQSGGEKTVANLASLLLSNPDILVLDEPTNHLDIQMTEWLEKFLKNYKGTVVINSHDRYFLDKVVNKIVLLENGKSEIYHGNYSYFIDEEEKRALSEFEIYKNQQKKVTAMKGSIKKLREFGMLGNNEAFFRRANSIEKRLEKIEMLDRPGADKFKLQLEFEMKDRSGKDVLRIEDLGILLGDREILDGVNMELTYGEKACLLGKNGSGKSTLIRTILGDIVPDQGKVKIGSNVKIGYIPQEIYFEDEGNTILDEFRKEFSGTETALRSILAKFMFCSEDVFKRVGGLSGGEKVRLKLAELMQKDTNLLILDEPTNHIDIETRETLETALQSFKGTLLFVSHDRYFINRLANRTLEIDEKQVTNYVGNYDYYRETKEGQERQNPRISGTVEVLEPVSSQARTPIKDEIEFGMYYDELF